MMQYEQMSFEIPIAQDWPGAQFAPAATQEPAQDEAQALPVITHRGGVGRLAFTLDHDEDAAAARFLARFGYPPEKITKDGGYLLLGPVE